MKEQMIITTVNGAAGLSAVNESSSVYVNESLPKVPKGCLRMSGVFGVTGVMNNNNRYYTTTNYKKMVESLQARIKDGGVVGEFSHPASMEVDLPNATHKIEDIHIDESTGVVSGTILLLPTTKGKELQALVENGLKLKISSRGRGVVSESGEVSLSLLETYDLVYKPGFSQAVLSVCESEVNGETFILETATVDLNKPNQVSENSVDIEALKASIKSEILAESTQPKIDMSSVEKFMNEAIEKNVAESELRIQNLIKESMVKFSRATQAWSFNEFAPYLETYLNETAINPLKDSIGGITEGIEKWCTTELVQGIQSWAVNEFATDIETYFKNTDTISEMEDEDENDEDENSDDTNESDDDTTGDDTNDSSDDDTNESDDDSNDDSNDDSDDDTNESDDDSDDDSNDDSNDDSDDDTNESLSIAERIEKQLAEAAESREKENQISEAEQKQLNEAAAKEQTLIDAIPHTVQHLWESADDEFKTRVLKQAESREFVNESQMVRFWVGRFGKDAIKQISESTTTQTNINENSSANKAGQFAKWLNS